MKNKVGLLGVGKTGSKVLEVLNEKGYEVTVFNSTHPPELTTLNSLDGLIAFTPADVFFSYTDLLLQSSTPVITGHTGKEWPAGICDSVKKGLAPWIHAHNFSLAMVAVKLAIQSLAGLKELKKETTAYIHEIHHTQKKDAPSGTALSWKSWISPPFNESEVLITSERTGDIVGHHQLTLKSQSEEISLTHIAHDRKLFAQGAVWAYENLLFNKNLSPGIHSFEQLAMEFMKQKGQVK